MNELAIYMGSIGTLALVLIAIFVFLKSQNPALSRMQNSNLSNSSGTTIYKSAPSKKIEKILKPFQEKMGKEDVDTKRKRANLMISAGFYNGGAQTIFYAIRFTLAIFLAAGTATLLLLVGTRIQPLLLTIYVTLAGGVGYYSPLIYMIMRIKERRLKFGHGFPDAMDMILICLESGLSFPASLKHVSKELMEVHPVVSEHLEIVTLEFQAGRKRAEALKNLADRIDLPEVHSIVTMIIQSDALGTSLTRALNASSEDMRRDRMLKAEEKANALPAKMSIPLVLCIFPTLFCVIMVPVIVRIVRLIPG